MINSAATPPTILYLKPSPGSDPSTTAAWIRTVKDPRSRVIVASLATENGRFRHVEYRAYQSYITRGILRAARAAGARGYDAMVMGCFYDTALFDARELSGDMAVTGPCIASCEVAASLSNRFGILVGRPKWINQMRQTVSNYGYGQHVTGFYPVGLGVSEFRVDPARTEAAMLEAAQRAMDFDHAEALILGCTATHGFGQRLSETLGIPVIDSAVAALKRAEYAAQLRRHCGWLPSRKWSCEPPGETELAAFGDFDIEVPFGSVHVIQPS